MAGKAKLPVATDVKKGEKYYQYQLSYRFILRNNIASFGESLMGFTKELTPAILEETRKFIRQELDRKFTNTGLLEDPTIIGIYAFPPEIR